MGAIRFIAIFIITLHLAWDANPGQVVTGYKLYYGQASRQYTVTVDVGNVTDYHLSNIDETQPMFFAVTAYTDAAESEYSEELEVVTHNRKMAGKSNKVTLIEIENEVMKKTRIIILPTLRGL